MLSEILSQSSFGITCELRLVGSKLPGNVRDGPRGKMQVSCLGRVAMGPASSFPSGTQTSRTLPGSVALVRDKTSAQLFVLKRKIQSPPIILLLV